MKVCCEQWLNVDSVISADWELLVIGQMIRDDAGGAMQWSAPLPTCGRVPQCASRIGCLVTGDVGGGQEETGMKMTSVRKSAGRGRGEIERERVWRGHRKRLRRRTERETLFLVKHVSWDLCGWGLMIVQIQWSLEETVLLLNTNSILMNEWILYIIFV